MRVVSFLRSVSSSVLCAVMFTAGYAAQADPAAPTLDSAAFDQLKALAGRWEGAMEAPATGAALIEFEVTSNGRAIIERQFGGTAHEMITVFSLAHDRLQANHFCAMGNQPAYRLAETSTPRDIRMEFVGGTGLDPQKDHHANGERIEVVGPDELRVEFQFRTGQEPPTSASMRLSSCSVIAERKRAAGQPSLSSCSANYGHMTLMAGRHSSLRSRLSLTASMVLFIFMPRLPSGWRRSGQP